MPRRSANRQARLLADDVSVKSYRAVAELFADLVGGWLDRHQARLAAIPIVSHDANVAVHLKVRVALLRPGADLAHIAT